MVSLVLWKLDWMSYAKMKVMMSYVSSKDP